MMQSKDSVHKLAEASQRQYATVFRMVGRLRENLHLAVSSLNLKGVTELDRVCVTAVLK